MRGANGGGLAVRGWQTPTTKITTTYRAGGLATEIANGKANGGDGLARLLDGM